MVGGFSECELVQRAMKNEFPKKKIIIPEEAGLAVLKGTVLYGYQPKINKRILKNTYGIQSWPEWDPEVHPETKRVRIDGTDRCKDVFYKVAVKDEKVKFGHSYGQIFKALKPDERTLECTVYISDDTNPRYVTDPSCQCLGNLIVPLTPLNKGQSLEIEETMIFGVTELLFRAKNIKTGEIYETLLEF
ncbi:heat shock 70 kDa protein 12A-like [Mytilus edulis]|uniref:heat shock 70 kDa protein 12A-like n=1 Tax=Mytilus edulis TaxID=6550 RepID=UPI0039EF8AAE